jgi:hypothetical protein
MGDGSPRAVIVDMFWIYRRRPRSNRKELVGLKVIGVIQHHSAKQYARVSLNDVDNDLTTEPL